MEIWAYCDDCRRWFYCPDWFDRDQPTPVCPACCQEPVAVENRAALATRGQAREADGSFAGPSS